MPIELIIYDNDGVLVDSEIWIKQAMIEASAELGAHIDKTWAYANTQGRAFDDVIQRIMAYTHTSFEPEEFTKHYKHRVHKLYEENLTPTLGIPNIFKKLDETGLKRCVATSGKRDETNFKYNITGLNQHFPNSHIFTRDQVKHGKPNPELFLLAAKTMGVKPENCVVIEDSVFGLEAAKAAGMTAIGYVGGSHVADAPNLNAEGLKSGGAQYILEHHDDLIDLLGAL